MIQLTVAQCFRAQRACFDLPTTIAEVAFTLVARIGLLAAIRAIIFVTNTAVSDFGAVVSKASAHFTRLREIW